MSRRTSQNKNGGERNDALMSAGVTRDPSDLTHRVAAEFAAQACAISGVRTVAAVPLGDALSVWVVLDGDATGQVRLAVYELEARFLRQYRDALIDFRLIDAAEYPASRDAGLLPTGAQPIVDHKSGLAVTPTGNA